MNDQYAPVPSCGDNFVHAGGHLGDAIGGDFAFESVPHVANNDRRLLRIEMLRFVFEGEGAVVRGDGNFCMTLGGLPLRSFHATTRVEGECVFRMDVKHKAEKKIQCKNNNSRWR